MRIKNIEELESFSAYLGTVWFDRYQDLVSYILNEGKVSFGAGATGFLVNIFQPITHTPMLEKKFSHCIVNCTTLQSKTPHGIISAENIISIRISHHWSYDELHIRMTNRVESVLLLENAETEVKDNGCISSYALCKLDYI